MLIPVSVARHNAMQGLIAAQVAALVLEAPTVAAHPSFLQACQAVAYATTAYGAAPAFAGTFNFGGTIFAGFCANRPSTTPLLDQVIGGSGKSLEVAGLPWCVTVYENDQKGARGLVRELLRCSGMPAALASRDVAMLSAALLTGSVLPVPPGELLTALQTVNGATGMFPAWGAGAGNQPPLVLPGNVLPGGLPGWPGGIPGFGPGGIPGFGQQPPTAPGDAPPAAAGDEPMGTGTKVALGAAALGLLGAAFYLGRS